MWLIVLAGFLAHLWVCIAIVERHPQVRTKLFYTLFLLQQVAMLGIFVALDLFLYYGFWEFSLVPMTLLIAVPLAVPKTADVPPSSSSSTPSSRPPCCWSAMLWLYERKPTPSTCPRLQARSPHQHTKSLASTGRACWICSHGLPGRLRRQGPRLPAARLAAGGRLRSPHRRRDGSRWETRPLLHPALQLWHLS